MLMLKSDIEVLIIKDYEDGEEEEEEADNE
jgi:hypothetical protein